MFDANEGILNCYSCETDENYKLKCILCKSNYILNNGECKSLKELYPIEGCDYIKKEKNNSYICALCKSYYILIENNYTCVPKTEETQNYDQGIYNINDNIIDCTECSYNYELVKDSNGISRCFHYKLSYILSKCLTIINKVSYENPFFVCENCLILMF